jgi:S1-C subfamily serine protease
MDWRRIMLVTCISSLSILSSPVSTPPVKVFAQPSSQHSAKQLQHLAESITVKVLSRNFLGSGILIHKQGNIYTVLTNAHVLKSGHSPYQVQTPDGRIYTATLSSKSDRSGRSYFSGDDLAMLQFRSANTYTLASLGSTSTLSVGNEVFAAGFPFDPERNQDKGFVFETGQVSLVLKKALQGGYQIGYTNDIQKGMSGGPLLNRTGKLVAINGMHAEPLWGNPYVYQDGTEPEAPLREEMSQYSWGIPIETFVKVVPP